MTFTKRDFLTADLHTIYVDEWLSVEDDDFLHHTQVKSNPQIHVTGALHYDGDHLVNTDLQMKGVMIVPDSITNEDLEVEFDTASQETYSFSPNADNEDMIVVKHDTIDVNPEILQAVLYEAPMSISRLPRDQYPSGNGWQLISDQDEPEEEIDPRWEKLKNFKFEDD